MFFLPGGLYGFYATQLSQRICREEANTLQPSRDIIYHFTSSASRCCSNRSIKTVVAVRIGQSKLSEGGTSLPPVNSQIKSTTRSTSIRLDEKKKKSTPHSTVLCLFMFNLPNTPDRLNETKSDRTSLGADNDRTYRLQSDQS